MATTMDGLAWRFVETLIYMRAPEGFDPKSVICYSWAAARELSSPTAPTRYCLSGMIQLGC